MKCYLYLFFAIAGAKKEKHVDETTVKEAIQTLNSTEATFVGQFEQHFEYESISNQINKKNFD